MLQQLAETPKNFERHIKRYAASVVTSVSYGRRVESMDEWIVVENNQSMDCGSYSSFRWFMNILTELLVLVNTK